MKVFFTIFIFSLFPHFFIAISNENGQKRDESSAPKVDSINQLHWLVGNWEGPIGEGVLGESWLPPRYQILAADGVVPAECVFHAKSVVHAKSAVHAMRSSLQIEGAESVDGGGAKF